MSRGVVIFAFNNLAIDYVAMAKWSARRIHQHLDLPVTLITDTAVSDSVFDQVINVQPRTATSRWFQDFDSSLPWHNANRIDAFELSPYDQTIVLDSDYVVASDQLLTLFDSHQDFLTHCWAVDVTDSHNYQRNNYFGKFAMPMCWATVLYFEKTNTANAVFEMMSRIKHNWTHYRNLYGIADPTYRNDFAVSVAANVVYGYQANYPSIPWNLLNVEPAYQITQIDRDVFRIDFEQEKKSRYITIDNCDFHAMNKRSLGEIVENSK